MAFRPPTTQTITGRTRPQTDGSRTFTLDPAQPSTDDGANEAGPSRPSGVLRLRGLPPRDAPRVNWDENVVDNEGMGKKKSKICCIYHKPRPFDESSSSSSESSDGEGDEGEGAGKGDEGKPQGQHMHPHSRPRKSKRPKCDDSCDHSQSQPSPNAYEVQKG